MQQLSTHPVSSDEYRAIPQPHHPGRWIIVYAAPVRGFEADSVDAVSYPDFQAAAAALKELNR